MNDLTRRRFEELKSGGVLPSPQGVALTLLEVTGRADANLRDVTRLVQLDPAIAGRILRYANAAQGGGMRHIVSLGAAINFLGLFRVRQIALGFSLIDQYRGGTCAAFDYSGYWTSSLATGIAAQKLAPLVHSPADESFSCGLLAGVGRLGFATAFPEEYSALLQRALAPAALAGEERNAFGIDHAELSAEMLGSWGLPEVFTSAVRDCEQPARTDLAPGSRAHALCASLHFAMKIGRLLNLDEAQQWAQIPSLFSAAAQVGMEEDAVPALVKSVVTDWQAWAQELHLPARNFSDVRELLMSPPVESKSGGSPILGPLRVALLVGDKPRGEDLMRALVDKGLRVDSLGDALDAVGAVAASLPDLAIIDTRGCGADAVARLRELRNATGNALHIIALIPADTEAGVTQLLHAGAADYLLYDYTQAALLARLSNARRLLALEGTVRTERRLAVSSSGDLARANRRLLQEALTDPLTQLPNRRYGLDRFAQEWSIASSNALPIACLMLDIDHFKRVNDRRGHDIGDVVLQQVAAVIERNCRSSDIVFRYGGEEFCCISPRTAAAEALQLGERIAAAVREARYGPRDDAFAVTISVGVAVRSARTQDPNELIAVADRALYAAKKAGRNRVCGAQS